MATRRMQQACDLGLRMACGPPPGAASSSNRDQDALMLDGLAKGIGRSCCRSGSRLHDMRSRLGLSAARVS